MTYEISFKKKIRLFKYLALDEEPQPFISTQYENGLIHEHANMFLL